MSLLSDVARPFVVKIGAAGGPVATVEDIMVSVLDDCWLLMVVEEYDDAVVMEDSVAFM